MQVQRSQCYYYSLASKGIRPCRWSLFGLVCFVNVKKEKETDNKWNDPGNNEMMKTEGQFKFNLGDVTSKFQPKG